jgi:oligosaccharyltransferase complex subunit delta (ribophorin II)
VTSLLLTAAFSVRLNPKSALPSPVTLRHADTAKISLVAKDNGKGKRPHQAFVILKEEDSGLEAPFPLTVREDGRASVQIVSVACGSGC